jgi:hypothetical protein
MCLTRLRLIFQGLVFGVGVLAFAAAIQQPAKAAEQAASIASVSADPNDWPMYNHDCVGTRHNTGENTLGKENVGQLVEKWRFPTEGSNETIGVVHATVVVNGHVYFGTETTPTFYKLTPDGKVKWAYRPPSRPLLAAISFGLPTAGIINAALVTNDMVYFGDMGGVIYALDRATGNERWKVDTRAEPFPGAHSSNCVFSSPILAEGLVVVGGGAFEHAVAATPWNRGCTGRGFVVALEPGNGKVVWKYDVGPEPGALLFIGDGHARHLELLHRINDSVIKSGKRFFCQRYRIAFAWGDAFADRYDRTLASGVRDDFVHPVVQPYPVLEYEGGGGDGLFAAGKGGCQAAAGVKNASSIF